MVKKLLKYDFSALSKPLIPMYIVMLSIALFNRIVQFFESDGVAYNIFFISSTILFVISIAVSFVYTLAVCVVRFYKNLYSHQGYLTLTLPASHSEHILSKLISSVCAMAVTLLAVIISVSVCTAGDVFGEIIKAALYIFKQYFRLTKVHGAFYILEFILVLLATTVAELLTIFTSVTVGQLAKKNRILLAFGVYFGIYVAWQIIETVLLIIGAVFVNTDIAEKLLDYIAENTYQCIHIALIGFLLIQLAVSFAGFFITRKIMRTKLNLE
ncbi:MAG: hypothetical protein IJJ40_00895 [Clostridia bacterium]|nr:hypothetical protein [Clostridia bacterium]